MPLPVTIVPGESIGPFKLGMSRSEVWAQDRSPIHAFYKTPMSENRTDDVRRFGLHVFYDEADCAEYFEAWTRTEHFHTTLHLGEFTLSGRVMGEVRSILRELGFPFSEDRYGFQCPEFGIGFYCHDFESDESTLDGVTVMKREQNQPVETTQAVARPARLT